MIDRIHLVALTLLAACTSVPASDPEQPAMIVARESDNPAAHMARLKAVIRQDAVTSYGAECGTIEVPDNAFIPVEITGGGLPEIAVTFGRVHCGLGMNRFSGTGGVMMQFWIGSGGPVRLLLEKQMHGFTPAGTRLITMQHGAYCPGGAGPDQCRVIYQWNDQDRRLDVIERRLASTLNRTEPMTYDWEKVSRLLFYSSAGADHFE
jgi:hypothetical protein